ncbi:hypothetical protein M8R20_05345 [Pseudomonas sp. R2.Fl]|nr:hypothetical protein [Pseudomonas sp. R2.Fl]
MKIDSSLSNYFYQSRFQQDAAEPGEAANDAGSPVRPNTPLNPAISSTLLSPTLSSALWVIEGGRGSGKSDTTSSRTAANQPSAAEKVQAFYMEFEEEA